jgi:hypothetical protein
MSKTQHLPSLNLYEARRKEFEFPSRRQLTASAQQAESPKTEAAKGRDFDSVKEHDSD